MRGLGIGLCGSLALLLAAPFPVSSETRDEYLSRLRDVCEVGCMQPRELLRTARKRGSAELGEMAGILDIKHVSYEGGKYRLHTTDPERLDRRDAGFDFGMAEYRQPELIDPSDIMVEIDEQTLLDLFNVPASASAGARGAGDDGEILVEGDTEREVARPTLGDLRSRFYNRRIVVRGSPRLETVFIGARRDPRRKQLTLQLTNADDLVVLPRFDEEGRPQFDEREQGLKEFYERRED